ncbi:MAG: DUF1289 domain-containing protein [Gammaproteobacteria bacterium]
MDKSIIKPPIIDTPCIGICSTVYGDEICRGCKRFYKEIIDWNTYDSEQKHQVFVRLSASMRKVMNEFLVITDSELLFQQLQNHSIRYYATDDPLCWAHHLLRVGGEKIHDITRYGIEIKKEYRHLSLTELFTLIDEQLYLSTEN